MYYEWQCIIDKIPLVVWNKLFHQSFYNKSSPYGSWLKFLFEVRSSFNEMANGKGENNGVEINDHL